MCVKSFRLFATPWTVACQAPLFMGFSRQEYWSGLPCPPPGDPPNPGIRPRSLISPALAGGFFTTELPGKLSTSITKLVKSIQYRFDISQSIYAAEAFNVQYFSGKIFDNMWMLQIQFKIAVFKINLHIFAFFFSYNVINTHFGEFYFHGTF